MWDPGRLQIRRVHPQPHLNTEASGPAGPLLRTVLRPNLQERVKLTCLGGLAGHLAT